MAIHGYPIIQIFAFFRRRALAALAILAAPVHAGLSTAQRSRYMYFQQSSNWSGSQSQQPQ